MEVEGLEYTEHVAGQRVELVTRGRAVGAAVAPLIDGDDLQPRIEQRGQLGIPHVAVQPPGVNENYTGAPLPTRRRRGGGVGRLDEHEMVVRQRSRPVDSLRGNGDSGRRTQCVGISRFEKYGVPKGRTSASHCTRAAWNSVVVARLERVGRDPPAHVDVVDRAGPPSTRCADPSGRGSSSRLPVVKITDDVPRTVPLPELQLMPDQVDVVDLLGHRLGRPPATTSALNELDARVDPRDVIGKIGGDSGSPRSQAFVRHVVGNHQAGGHLEALDEALQVDHGTELTARQLAGVDRAAAPPLRWRHRG